MFIINIFPYKNFCLVVSADDIVILKMILDRVDENCDALCLWGIYFSHASLEVHLVQRTDLSQSLPRNFIFKWRKSIESYIEVRYYLIKLRTKKMTHEHFMEGLNKHNMNNGATVSCEVSLRTVNKKEHQSVYFNASAISQTLCFARSVLLYFLITSIILILVQCTACWRKSWSSLTISHKYS